MWKRWRSNEGGAPHGEMNALVTGAAGYIGSHTLHALCAAGHRAIGLDDLSAGYRSAIPAAVLVEGDIADKALLSRTVKEHSVGAVVHCAARADVSDSVANPGPYLENNIAKGVKFLECLRALGVRLIVFSSSAAVYGDPERVPISEEDRKAPKSPYGLTKLVFEQILDWYDKAYGLRYVSLRYLCAAGAAPELGIGEDHRPERHLIPSVLLSILGERPRVEVYGTDYPTEDGTAIRDFVHVMDVASAHILALSYLASGGSSLILNVGLGQGFSVRQVIDVAERVTGRSAPVEVAGRRAGDPAVLVADPRRLAKDLGWKPRFARLEEIVASAWEWHRSHPRGFSS